MSDRTHDQSTALAGIDDERVACSDSQYETTPRADDFDNQPTFRRALHAPRRTVPRDTHPQLVATH